jgi:short-subunit dehydrogenase
MNVVITGATKGIGLAISKLFAAQGANVAICARTMDDIVSVAKALSEEYPNIEILGHPADMSIKEDVKEFAAIISENWDQVDVLINNAGVFIPGPMTELDEETEDAFELMMNTNLYSAYYMTQALLPLMLPHQSGHIFNMCSIASIMPYGAYAVSKHAMLGFSRVLREELMTKGIRVTAVMPGATYTASWAGTDIPEERFMKATDIAEAVWGCYQLSPQTVVEELILRPQLGDI